MIIISFMQHYYYYDFIELLLNFCDMCVVKRVLNGGKLIIGTEVTPFQFIPDKVIDQDTVAIKRFFSQDGQLILNKASKLSNLVRLL